MLDRIDKPVMRNRVHAFTSCFFTALQRKRKWRTGDNPAKGIERERESIRERVLSVDEQRALAAAIDDIKDAPERTCLRFLLMTGWRSSEALSLQWDWIELPGPDAPDAMTVVRLPDTKTGAQRRTLPPQVAALLVDLPRFANHPRVFFGTDYERVRARFNRICRAAGIEGVRLHDLRRTFATSNAPHVGITVLRDLLGHKTISMAARYARQADTELEAAQRAAVARQSALLDDKPEAPVERLRTA